MRTIRLDINDSVYDKVIAFLSELSQNDVHIVSDQIEKDHRKFHSISLKTKGFRFNREEANAR